MVEKSLHRLVKQHLSPCLLPGTRIKESGITVSTNTRQGETILFFRIDSDEGRRCLSLANGRCCDCLVFYTKERVTVEMLCFLELKAAKLPEAVEQIISAHQQLKQLLDTSGISTTILMCCICMRQQAPVGDRRSLTKLKAIFKEHVYLKSGTTQYTDFGSLFRKQLLE